MTRGEQGRVCPLCAQGVEHERCAAHRSGAPWVPCMAWPVRGGRVCRAHGGGARQVRDAADRSMQEEEARAAAARHALPRDVDPGTALLEEVRRSAGLVEWLWQQIIQVEPGALIRGTRLIRRTDTPDGPITVTEVGPGVNLWWKLHQEERRHLTGVCRSALEAGVAERQIRLAERQGELIADGITWLLAELGHEGDERAVQAAHRMLTCLDGGLVPGREAS